jgi:hypothetical protein
MTRYAKFIVSALVAGLTVLASAITDDKVTNAEWVNVALAAVGAVAVWRVPNRPPASRASDPRMSEQGYGLVELLVAAFFAVLIVELLVAAF